MMQRLAIATLATLASVVALGSGCGFTSTEAPPLPMAAGDPEPIHSGFFASAQEHIAAREYWASPTQDGLQAPNRRHDLRSWFGPTGVRVHERGASGSPKLVELQLSGVGRGERLSSVAPGEVTHHEGRVEIHRKGLVEWYENSERGLEQGFTLAERPAAATPGELVLELSITGARASLRGEDVALATGAGRKLAYGKLAVVDANGDRLLARFDVAAPDRVRLVADDTHAAYPITIDPLLEETADAVLESNEADAYFGSSVASAGDVNGDGYDDVIIGAPTYDAGQTDEGAAFVFLGSPSGIADANPATAHAQLEGDSTNAQMSTSVASAGDVNGDGYDDVIVGAPLWFNEGAAFLFLGSASGIADGNPASADAQFEGNQLLPFMGYSVASAGDVNGDGYDDVIVGAPTYSVGGFTEGAAFVFLGSATGIPDGSPASADTRLDGEISSKMGQSVASAGDVNGDGYDDVIVGAQGYSNGQTFEGAAFVFLGSATGIPDANPTTAHARFESDQANAFMGQSVASAGDVNSDGYADVIVGVPGYNFGQSDEGAAFVFHGSATGITSGNPVSADSWIESDQVGAKLGTSVAAAGDVNGDGYSDVVVGAPFYDAGQTDEGAAFVYLGGATGVLGGGPVWAHAQLESDQASANMGKSVASAGDVNGDGYADVIAGAHFFDAGHTDEGAAFVYYGGGTGIVDGDPFTANTQLAGVQAASVASAGDVNGDGYADVIIGAPNYDGGQVDEGAAFIFLGSANGIASGSAATAHAQLEGDNHDAWMGWSVASAGDVNGDGYADAIVGAYRFGAGASGEGGAFIFLGSAAGIADGSTATADTQLVGDHLYAAMGSSVASAGDVNGDGFADVIVGGLLDLAPGPEFPSQSAAFVFLGSSVGIANGNQGTADAQLAVGGESDSSTGFNGYRVSVASAGDVNGDGYSDVIVGSPLQREIDHDGAAYVFLGSAAGVQSGDAGSAQAVLKVYLRTIGLGFSVASAGDVNGDGYSDVIVGAPYGPDDEIWPLDPQFAGSAFVWFGSAAGIGPFADELNGGSYGARMGSSVASAGDVNGDGFADVIVGAEGLQAAFVFFGPDLDFGGFPAFPVYAQLDVGSTSPVVASAGDVNGDGYADVIVGAPAAGAAYVFLGNSGNEGRPTLARQRRGDGSGIIVQPWGSAADPDGFEVELLASHPNGVGRVRAEVEACPAGVAFEELACTTSLSPAWIQLAPGTADLLLSTTVSGLAPGTLYHWRARILYADATGPIPTNPAHGPWRRLGGQSVEGDIRTVPEPGALAGLLVGCALLFGMQQRRMVAFR